MKLSILAGSTSQTINLFLQDSSSTTGAGLAGLVFNSAGLTAYYALPKATPVAITLATLAAVTSAFSSGGFKEMDSVNMPGWYRFDIPDAALASGRFVNFHFQGAANMAPLPVEIELTAWNNQSATDGGLSKLTSLTFTGANKVDASTRDVGGTTVTGRDIGASVLLSSGTGTGQLDFTSGVVKANPVQWNGTVVSTPATAGIPEVNVKNINNVATTSVTTVNANVGSTQPFNFTGTGASALVKSDMVDVAGAAVSTSTAQIGVNAVNVGGTAQTGRDIGASVLLSSGTGTGQLDFTSGVVKANLAQILGTALTETSGQIAAAFKKFFDKATPTGTINSLPDAVPGATGGLLVDDVWTDARAAKLDNLDATVSSRSTYAGGDTSGTTTLLSRLSATRAGYLDNLSAGALAIEASVQSVLAKLLSYVQLILRKDSAIATDNVIELTAINANGGSGMGSYDNITDSQQALSDASPDVGAIADAVWEEAIADHSGTAGSTAEQLAAAGAAGDPWATTVPGAYGAGTAGQILGDNLDVVVSTRASETTVDTRLPAALVGGRMDSNVGAIAPSFITDIQDGLATSADVVALTGDIGSIKGKTDSLTFTVPGVVDANVEDWKGATAPAMTGDAFARLGAPTGASVSADIVAVKADAVTIKTVTNALPNSGALTTIASGVSNIQSRIPAALTGDGNIKADTLALNGQSAMRIGESIKGIGLGTVSAGATTTSIPTSSTDPGVIAADQFKGRIITFKALTTTAALRGQSTVIESNTDTGIFTVVALTTAPVSGDEFILS